MSGWQLQQTSHFDAIYDLLPPTLKAGIDDLLSRATRESAVKHTLDQLLRFSLGRDATDEYMDSREGWNVQKLKAEKALSRLQPEGGHNGRKRSRDESDSGSVELGLYPKRPKIETPTDETVDVNPVFTLHSVSVSAPVRKKVNITLYRNDKIRLTHATSGAQEASLPLSSLTRAFLISTPGKSKAHWTVVILTNSDQNQVIFGLDAVISSMTTTVHPEPPHNYPKGTESKSILTQFLSYLPPQVIFQEPSIKQFRSPAGDPYLDAYLRAKDGHLFFFEDGLLFGEKRPCMWIGIDQIESVRSLSATGRTFSLFVTRVADTSQEEEPGEGEETEFSLIDGKNQDAVALWVKNNRPRFGVHEGVQNNIQMTLGENELDESEDRQEKKANEDSEDSDDSDFESDSGSDGGSATSQSSGDQGEEGRAEAEDESNSDSDDNEGGELSSSRHPLLRPGAMPKMSKAAVNTVIDMVGADLMDVAGGKTGAEDEEDELDELEA